jgi:hypothetical protein
LTCRAGFHPGNAVAAVIVIVGRYLRQLRDPGAEFSFRRTKVISAADPGGAVVVQALAHELAEELGVKLSEADMRLFVALQVTLCVTRSRLASSIGRAFV